MKEINYSQHFAAILPSKHVQLSITEFHCSKFQSQFTADRTLLVTTSCDEAGSLYFSRTSLMILYRACSLAHA